MKLLTREQVEELSQAIEKAVQVLKHRYPSVVELRKVTACIQEDEFFLYIDLGDAIEMEAIIRGVAWDILPDDRSILIEVVRSFERLLG